jgi:hypothetical protein
MAKKQARQPAAAEPRPSVTPDRFRRLHQLVRLLGSAPQKRSTLLAALKIDLRAFYRDLRFLRRAAGITVNLGRGKYSLEGDVEAAADRLPFPDPLLTLGEAKLLAKGRGRPQARLAEEVRVLCLPRGTR